MSIVQEKKRRRIINSATFIALTLTFLFIFIPSFIYAAEPIYRNGVLVEEDSGQYVPDYGNTFPEMLANDLLKGVLKNTSNVLTGKGKGPLASVYKATVKDDITETYKTVYDVLKTIGAMWCLGIALSHLFTNLEKGIDPMEAVYKVLIEIAIAGIFIMFLSKMMGTITKIGMLINETIGNTGEAFAGNMTGKELLKIMTGEEKGDAIWWIKTSCMLIPAWLITKIMAILSNFIAVQILFEIAIRKMFAPLAVADIYQEGMRSPGARYFKKYLASIIRLGLTIFLCIMAADVLTVCKDLPMDNVLQVFSFIVTIIAIQLACVALMFKTSQYANEITGV